MRIDRLIKTIHDLSLNDEVGEIILIDNSVTDKKIYSPKLEHIKEKENTFINPAWNKGASLAKYDKLCFLNDDIWFDWKYLHVISDHIRPDLGIIGMAPENYKENPGLFSISHFQGRRPTGYACCFFVHKSNWDPIPDDMKLWAGDDWLFYRSKKPN